MARSDSLFTAKPLPKTKLAGLLFPVGLTMIPGLLLLFSNAGRIADPQPILEVTIGAGVLAALLARFLWRDFAPHVAAGIIGAFGYGFFSLSWLDVTSPAIRVGAWLLTSLIGAVLVVWLLSNSRLVLNIATSAVVFACAGLGIVGLLPSNTDTDSAVPAALAFTEQPTERPNIYVFVLDGFARPEITIEQFAEHQIDFDISRSLESLEDLDFVLEESGSANYPATILSLPATLNGQYHHTPESPLSADEIWSQGQTVLSGDNALVGTLQSVGYRYWHANATLWAASSCDASIVDRCLSEASANSEAWSAIWSTTPLRSIFSIPDLLDNDTPLTVVEKILEARDAEGSAQPTFTFSHIISPHQPYQFNADCSLRDSQAPGQRLGDPDVSNFRPLYVGQATCLAQQLEEAMTTLIEADPTAIILLQADHGSEFEADQLEDPTWDPSYIRERFGIFRMSRLPDSCRSADPAAQSVVNTAELLTSCLSGTEPDFVVPRIFLGARADDFAGVVEADEGLIPAN